MTIRVAVLGCGPAGLLAVHAVEQLGFHPYILSRKVKSKMGGAQYLHESIPNLTPSEPDGFVTYVIDGDKKTYARKVYGEQYQGDVSFDRSRDGKSFPAWNLTTLYNELWDRYHGIVADVQEIGPGSIYSILDSNNFDTVVSTIPLRSICINPVHSFDSQAIYINQVNVNPIPDGTIQYDGTENHLWYRQSNLWGWLGTEWSKAYVASSPPFGGTINVIKPIRTNCDCWPTIIRAGRYGQWNKGILTHHAYQTTLEELRHKYEMH